MEYAYLGEVATGSCCGRMDQACAFGSRPTLLLHDGDRLEAEPIALPKTPLHLLVVDLGCDKDTPLMLKSLQRSFPCCDDDRGRRVHSWLGEENQRRVADAVKAVRAGDAETLGALMTAAQAVAEAMMVCAYAQLVRKGAPFVLGNFLSSMSLKSGAPTFGMPEPVMSSQPICSRIS